MMQGGYEMNMTKPNHDRATAVRQYRSLRHLLAYLRRHCPTSPQIAECEYQLIMLNRMHNLDHRRIA